MARPSILEIAQYGLETTRLTAVAATKRMQGIHASIDIATMPFVSQGGGYREATGITFGKEVSNGKITGDMDFNTWSSVLGFWCSTSATVAKPAAIYTLNLGGTSGSFTLTYNAVTSSSITHTNNTTNEAAAIQAALEAMSTIGVGNVFVESVYSNGAAVNNQYTITFQFALGTTTLALTASLVGLTGATLTNQASTNTKCWNFSPAPISADTISTFTLELGQLGVSGQGRQAPGCYFDAVGFKAARNSFQWSANICGGQLVDPFTMTAAGSVTDVAQALMPPSAWALYMGTSSSSMTLIPGAFEFDFSSSNKWERTLTINPNDLSYSSLTDAAQSVRVVAKLQLDSANAQPYIATMRNATTIWVRLVCNGSTIESGFNNKMVLTMPMLISDQDYETVDGVVVGTLKLQPKYDVNYGAYMKWMVYNTVTAL